MNFIFVSALENASSSLASFDRPSPLCTSPVFSLLCIQTRAHSADSAQEDLWTAGAPKIANVINYLNATGAYPGTHIDRAIDDGELQRKQA